MPEADVPALAAALGRELRAAGIPCTPERSARFARAVALAHPASRAALYWTARPVYVSAHAQLPAFDAVFARVFGEGRDPADARGDPMAPPLPAEALAPAGRPPVPGAVPAGPTPAPGGRGSAAAGRDDTARDAVWRAVALAGADERLATKDLAALDAEELAALRRVTRLLALAPPLRRTRRLRRARRGRRLDVRATLRAGHRTGGDPVRLVRRRHRLRPRRLVVLCDVSGSMEPYSRAFLAFLHGAVGGARAEAFVFATRLTRVTRALRAAGPDLALRRAAAAAPDWAGGTSIAAALDRFVERHGRRGMARGAVVVVVSDGWERGDPARVGDAMARLGRLAHRIVWINPRVGAPGFEPTAGGMAAALPHVDALAGGRDLTALTGAIAAIGGPITIPVPPRRTP
jgi:uncharacterized protein with von Willebrand factor type A (vWA) domain